MHWDMAAVMSDMISRMMPANGPGGQQAAAMGAIIGKASIIAGLVVNLVLSAAKLIYYAVGWSYLCRPPVRLWLENAGEPSPF
jgi:hypothetical protein